MGMSAVPTKILQQAVDAVVMSGGNKEAAALALGIPCSTIKYQLKLARQRNIKASKNTVNPDDPKVLRGQIKQLQSELKQHEKQSDLDSQILTLIGGMGEKLAALNPPEWIIHHRGKASTP